MNVGCLEYPGASTFGSKPLDGNNAPMAGTTVQPSHEPSHERKQTGTRHTEKYQWSENGYRLRSQRFLDRLRGNVRNDWLMVAMGYH